jgi:hypothetical protein
MAHIYSHPPKVVNDELHLITRSSVKMPLGFIV